MKKIYTKKITANFFILQYSVPGFQETSGKFFYKDVVMVCKSRLIHPYKKTGT